MDHIIKMGRARTAPKRYEDEEAYKDKPKPRAKKVVKKEVKVEEDYDSGDEVKEEVAAAIEAPPPVDNEEKRARPFRKHATADIAARIGRAITQRLYLINQTDVSTPGNLERKYAVLGSTGNLYDVNICKLPTCSCPDFGRSRLCKHILFVQLKVLRIDSRSELVYQDALLQSELAEIFGNAPAAPSDVQAKAEVVTAYKNLTAGESSSSSSEPTESAEASAPVNDKVPEGDCPVCFEDLPNGEALDSCKTCKNFIHVDCLKMWLGRSQTCCYCRNDWHSFSEKEKPAPKKSQSNYEGYTNLAAIQGMSTKRDTSTYRKAAPRRRRDWDDEGDY